MTRAAILAKIAELEAKQAKQRDPLCAWYYAMCLVGWRKMLEQAP